MQCALEDAIARYRLRRRKRSIAKHWASIRSFRQYVGFTRASACGRTPSGFPEIESLVPQAAVKCIGPATLEADGERCLSCVRSHQGLLVVGVSVALHGRNEPSPQRRPRRAGIEDSPDSGAIADAPCSKYRCATGYRQYTG